MLTLFVIGDTINNVKNKQARPAGRKENEVNTMKQVKLSDVKKVLKCENNNDLVQILMGLYNTRILRARDKGDDDLREWSERRFNALFDLLDNVGYYDDVKEN